MPAPFTEDARVLCRQKQGGPLEPVHMFRMVKAAAHRADLPGNVFRRWLRSAHTSHGLARGAPMSLVQATLSHARVRITGTYTHARPNHRSSSQAASAWPDCRSETMTR